MNFLDEIKRNAGEVQNENTKVRKPYTGTVHSYMFEMAAKDLTADVIDLLKNGKPIEAAEAYSGRPAGIATTVKGLFKRDPSFDKQVLLDFAKAVKPDISKSSYQGLEDALVTGEVKDRKAVKGSEGPGGLRTSSQSTQKTIKKAIDKIYKIRQEVLSKAKAAEQEGNEELERQYVSQLDGLDALLQSAESVQKSGKGIIDANPKKLKQRYNKIAKEFKAKHGTEYNIPKFADQEEYNPKDAEDALKNMRARRAKRYDPFADDDEDMENPIDYYDKRTQDRLKKELEKDKEQDEEDYEESFSLRGMILKEGLEYRGQNFWKNYVMTAMMKGFAKDLKVFGEDTKYLYTEAYGLMAYPIFEYMQENFKALNEVVKINSPLLFEDVGYNYLNEEFQGKRLKEATGFLSGLWNTIKEVGAPLVSGVSNLVNSGISWASKLAEQGIGWLTSAPVAQIAIPAVVLTGSAVAAAKLINKLRKKKGEEKLSKKEKEKLRRIANSRSEEIQKQTEQMRTAKKQEEPDEIPDEYDDEENLVSDED